MPDTIKIIPCSGIGKHLGLIARESVYKVISELCPDSTETLCLAYIMTGDEEAKALIEGQNCITIDGCPAMCAAKNAEIAGGIVIDNKRVIDAIKRHKGAKPGTPVELTDEGWEIVDEIAGEIAEKVMEIRGEG